MKAFRFPLEKALELRLTQLELEEAKLRRAAAALAEVDREREALLESVAAAEARVRGGALVAGEELAALGQFRAYASAQEKRIAQTRAQRAKELEAQRAAMLEARRRLRLLERLKARRQAEWTAEMARELEETAAESYLAQWNREDVQGNSQEPVK